MNDCLITGCDLHDTASNRWAHGDLHKIANAYVFNAVLTEKGEANWQLGLPDEARMVVRLAPSATSFERRGIIAFGEADATMNHAAWSHVIEGQIREREAIRRLVHG